MIVKDRSRKIGTRLGERYWLISGAIPAIMGWAAVPPGQIGRNAGAGLGQSGSAFVNGTGSCGQPEGDETE